MTTTIGILALQGDFAEHAATFGRIGVITREVRIPGQLADLDGLVIPGGESTTMARLLDAYELIKPLRAMALEGRPVWGTCAGAIIIARRAPGLDRPNLSMMDIGVERNAFGRQVDSFETDLAVSALGDPPFHAVFIRAPVISDTGAGVEVLARLPDGRIVAAREGSMLATAFHPELSRDDRFHEYFIDIVRQHAKT